jgi:hypothetical protein
MTDQDRINWSDDQWPSFEKGRADGYKAWNGKGDRLHGTEPTRAAYDILDQAVNEGLCEKDEISQHGYYTGSIRGLRGDPIDGVKY